MSKKNNLLLNECLMQPCILLEPLHLDLWRQKVE